MLSKKISRLLCAGLFYSGAGVADFIPLGYLDSTNFESVATGVSNDGSVISGYVDSISGMQGFYWNKDTGMQGIGILYPFILNSESAALGVSDNGKVLVGWATTLKSNQLSKMATRWTVENGFSTVVGPYSLLQDAGYDGVMVSGRQGSDESFYGGVLWQNNTAIKSYVLSGHRFDARAISADIPVIALSDSYVLGGEFNARSFLWDARVSGLVTIADLPGGSLYPQFITAEDISVNGKVVVGVSEGENGYEAFRWTQASGTQGLGTLSGFSSSHARGVSANGKIIVGDVYNNINDGRAFIYTANNGLQDLQSVLESKLSLNLTGWRLDKASAISANGMVIVGEGVNPQGKLEAWRVDISGLFSADTDLDTVDDIYDNCLQVSNVRQIDADQDGTGNYCDADLNNDMQVDGSDYQALRSRLGSVDREADLNSDGNVTAIDYALLRSL